MATALKKEYQKPSVFTAKSMSLIPASYSKAQTAGQIAFHIKAFPAQSCNCEEAYKHTIEFQRDGHGPVGSLSEYQQFLGHTGITQYVIYPRKGDGFVVCQYEAGIFKVLEWSE